MCVHTYIVVCACPVRTHIYCVMYIGMDKEDAEKLFVNEAAKLEKYGARSFPVKDSDDNDVTFYIGGRCVRIEYPSQDRIQQKYVIHYILTHYAYIHYSAPRSLVYHDVYIMYIQYIRICM